MIRWLRLAAIGTVILSIIGLGVVAGLFLVVNDGWVGVKVHPWLYSLFGNKRHEMWLPGLIAGWLACALAIAALVLWSMYYVYRRRQYESLIKGLERELANLRNLPFKEPAPLEDLPEVPSATAARIMDALDDDEGLDAR